MTLEPNTPEVANVSEVAGPQAESAVIHADSPDDAATVLDDPQRTLLRAVLNRLVPQRVDVPDAGALAGAGGLPGAGVLPGAGDLEVGMSIERTLGVSVRLRRLFLEGLADIAVAAHQQVGADFLTLDGPTQTTILEAVEQRQPAFFAALVEHTYRGYYTLAVVQRAVGFDPRPPQPLGHHLPPFDPSILDRQRNRAPFWRPAD
jgi:hypothetical protein